VLHLLYPQGGFDLRVLSLHEFSFYDFSMIYYDFSKLLQWVICLVLESSGGKNPFS
jgi:hypothetical protein